MADPQGHTLVVGGTKGAGRVMARLAHADGANKVSVIARSVPEDKTKTIDGADYWGVDVADKTALRHTLAAIIAKNGPLRAVVFFQRFRGTGDDWAGELATSLSGPKNVIDLLVDEFDLRDCAIVVTSSVNARFISKNVTAGYHVAKAGLNQLVRYYAVTLGPRGIRINSVSPASFLKEEFARFFLENRALMTLYERMIPLGRMCRAEDVVGVIQFLCGKAAAFVTGQDIVVDGGLMLANQEALVRDMMAAQDID